jgi:hypothetical protein
MQALEYGICCKPEDEKQLVRHVNEFLASVGYRKLYKSVPAGIRNPDQPDKEPRHSHYYYQFLKEHPRWYFDLYPNIDLDGKIRFPQHSNLGWTLYFNKVMPEQNSPADDLCLDEFCSSLCANVGFPVLLLRSYAPKEMRA